MKCNTHKSIQHFFGCNLYPFQYSWQECDRFAHELKDDHMHTFVFRIGAYSNTSF